LYTPDFRCEAAVVPAVTTLHGYSDNPLTPFNYNFFLTKLHMTNPAALMKMLEMQAKHKHSLGSPWNFKLIFEVQE
jgi:hypothetical protein